ncbi:hypothetical protein CNY89_29230, partial [Amaricoccus sp. HAR-UPW-R2A-40]
VASFGGPVGVKILSKEILHKSEVGGVAPEEVEACCTQRLARALDGRLVASFGGPVGVKILSKEILHKSEVGGVAPEEVE